MFKLTISIDDDDLLAIDTLADRHVMARRHGIARTALRAGLDQFVRDQSFADEHLRREARGHTHRETASAEHAAVANVESTTAPEPNRAAAADTSTADGQ